MSDLRENLGWVIGSIATAIAMAFGWIYQSGILSTLVGIIVGAGIAFFIQTRTQKRAWKREYSVRIAEEVYGSLFSEIKDIILALENKRYRHLGSQGWRMMQDDHRYFMVDKKSRVKFDKFYERIEKYDNAVYELREKILPRIFDLARKSVFKQEIQELSVHIKYEEENKPFSTTPNIIECLISETHPKDYVLNENPERKILEFQILYGQVPLDSTATEKFDILWLFCIKIKNNNRTYKFIIEENDKLLEEARNIQNEIVNRIEEPWKI